MLILSRYALATNATIVTAIIWQQMAQSLYRGLCLSERSSYLFLKYKINKHPPLLHGISFIGSLLTVLVCNHNFNLQMVSKYGDIVQINIGNLPFDKIHNLDLAYKVYILRH